MIIGGQLQQTVDEFPDKPAIIFENNVYTYKAFRDNVFKIQYGLSNEFGSIQNKRVAILIGNDPAFLEVFFACCLFGAIAVPFDPKWKKREQQQAIELAEAAIFIIHDSWDIELPDLSVPVLSIEELKKTDGKTDLLHIIARPDDFFYLGFTSGSTGTPKGFVRTHQSWVASFEAAEKAFQYSSNDVIVAPGPLCHSLTLFAAIHALHIGATFHVTPHFNGDQIFSIIDKQHVSVLYAVPTMLHRLSGQPKQSIVPVTILSAGAKLHHTIRENIKGAFPKSSLYEYYGASEFSFVSYASEADLNRYPDSVGKPVPGVQISIRDADGNPVPVNKTGKIYCISEFLFSGYINQSENWKQTVTSNGVTVGDVGFLNEEAYLTVIGREKNMIISGGLNIYPEEIEKVLKKMVGLTDALVAGEPDDEWGEKVAAYVHPASPDEKVSLHTIEQHCRRHLANYKCPKTIYYVKRFPYTSSGKIDRKLVESDPARWVIE